MPALVYLGPGPDEAFGSVGVVPQPGDRFALTLEHAITFGRSSRCVVRVPSEVVARRHAMAVLDADEMGIARLIVTDLGSTNGTYVRPGPPASRREIGLVLHDLPPLEAPAVGDFRRIAVARLADNDELSIAGLFRFRFDASMVRG